VIDAAPAATGSAGRRRPRLGALRPAATSTSRGSQRPSIYTTRWLVRSLAAASSSRGQEPCGGSMRRDYGWMMLSRSPASTAFM
jgi:hypothetical protein